MHTNFKSLRLLK